MTTLTEIELQNDKGATEKHCKKDKKRDKWQQKDAKKLTKKGRKIGCCTEIQKGTKNPQMPLTEHSKMLQKYKF